MQDLLMDERCADVSKKKKKRTLRRRWTFPGKVIAAGTHAIACFFFSYNSSKFAEQGGFVCIERGCGLRVCHPTHHGNCNRLINVPSRVHSPGPKRCCGDRKSGDNF